MVEREWLGGRGWLGGWRRSEAWGGADAAAARMHSGCRLQLRAQWRQEPQEYV